MVFQRKQKHSRSFGLAINGRSKQFFLLRYTELIQWQKSQKLSIMRRFTTSCKRGFAILIKRSAKTTQSAETDFKLEGLLQTKLVQQAVQTMKQ